MILTIFYMIVVLTILFVVGATRKPQRQVQGFVTMYFIYEASNDIILMNEPAEKGYIKIDCYRRGKRPKDAIGDMLEMGYCNLYLLENEVIYWERIEEENVCNL